jgi:hypothetical protein
MHSSVTACPRHAEIRHGRHFARNRSAFVAAALALAMIGGAMAAGADAAVILDTTLTGVNPRTGNDLAAHVVFSSSGNTLTLNLTNVGDPASAPNDVLTGLFWNLSGNPQLSPSSATLTGGGDSIVHSDGDNSLGKHWGFASFANSAFGVDKYGIGAAGFGLFGKGSFASPGANVQGVSYGLINGLGDDANGGLKVPLVSNSMTFQWSGLSSVPVISDVHAQFGSGLDETRLAASPVPEPGAASLLVLSAGAMLTRRRR